MKASQPLRRLSSAQPMAEQMESMSGFLWPMTMVCTARRKAASVPTGKEKARGVRYNPARVRGFILRESGSERGSQQNRTSLASQKTADNVSK